MVSHQLAKFGDHRPCCSRYETAGLRQTWKNLEKQFFLTTIGEIQGRNRKKEKSGKNQDFFCLQSLEFVIALNNQLLAHISMYNFS